MDAARARPRTGHPPRWWCGVRGGPGLLPLLCAAALSCGEFGIGCPATVRLAIEVEVRDAVTREWIAAGAYGAISEGGYLDSLRVVAWVGDPPDDRATRLGAGLGRAGRYTVTVGRAGYRPWERRWVVAGEGFCGVETTRLEALLQPL